MSTVSYLPTIQNILKELPDWDSNQSIGAILFNTIRKALEQGQMIADLGEDAINDAIGLYASSGIYQRATIIHACAGFIESEAMGGKILHLFSTAAEQDGEILRDVVLRALGMSGSTKSIPIINRFLEGPDALAASSAASALAMIDPHAAMSTVLSGKPGGVGEEELLELIGDLRFSKQPISQAQIAILLASEYPSVRLETLEQLVGKSRLSSSRLTELLKDSSAGVRSKALQLLVAQTKGENLDELLLKCLHDQNRKVVDTARNLLSRNRKHVIPRLLVEAQEATGYSLDAMINLLWDVKAPQLISRFGEVLKGKGRKQVRVSVVKWLVAQGRPAEIMPYLEIALKDQTTEVIDSALNALVKIGDDAASNLLSNHLLTTKLSFPAERVMNALSHFPTSVFETAVIRFLAQVDDVQRLWSIVKIIKRHHIFSALPQLREMRTTAPKDYLEYLDEAIDLLEGLDSSGGKSSLGNNLTEIRSRLSAKDVDTCLSMLDELPMPLDPQLIPDLEKLLFNDDGKIRSKAADCLHQLNAKGIAEKIRGELFYMSLKEKYKAAEALWILGDDSDHVRVTNLLYDPRRKGMNPDIAEMLTNGGVSEAEIERLTRQAQVNYLLGEKVQTDSIEKVFDGSRSELIVALEARLDEKSHFGWKSTFEQLKLIDWKPTETRFIALLASDEEDPQIATLDEESARWLGDFVSMSQDGRQVARMLRVLSRGGDQCKSTLRELINSGHARFSEAIASDLLQCFSRDEILQLLESHSPEQAEFGVRLIAISDWADKKDLVETRLSLAMTNKEDRFMQVTTSLLCEIDPETAKQFMINSLATSGKGLGDYTRGHFSKLLGEFGGSEPRLLLIGQLMENRPNVSKAAYNSLVSMGWAPSGLAESALAALYKPDHQAFESLGEEALPHVLAFMTGREKCGLSILTYIQRVISLQELDQTLIRTVLQAEWEYEAYRELPKLLALCPDITTDVLLELIPKQREGIGNRIRFTEYLSVVGTDKAIPTFITLLSSRYEHEIKLAAMAMGRLRHEPAIPLLGTALPNIRDKATYSAIVKAIAAIGGEQAVGLLRPLLPDLQTKVLRNAAEKAIAKWEKTCSKI